MKKLTIAIILCMTFFITASVPDAGKILSKNDECSCSLQIQQPLYFNEAQKAVQSSEKFKDMTGSLLEYLNNKK